MIDLIKLIAIDLDGTLVNTDSKVSSKDLDAIKKCQEKGIKISIITGRTIKSVGEITKELGLPGLHLASSGTAVIDENMKIHQAQKMPEELISLTVEESRKWDMAIVAHITDGTLVYEGKHPNFKYIDESDDLFIQVDDLLAPDIRKNSLSATILIGEDDEFNDHITGVIKDSGKVRRAGPFFLNIFGNKAGKLFGVKEILKETGIKKEELMVIGDSELDLGIIRYAAIGIAMGNASPAVKEGADYITSDNNSSGVAKAINKYILSVKNS